MDQLKCSYFYSAGSVHILLIISLSSLHGVTFLIAYNRASAPIFGIAYGVFLIIELTEQTKMSIIDGWNTPQSEIH